MFLLNEVIAAGRGDHPLVVDVRQARDLPDRSAVTSELIRMNDLWNVILTQETGQKRLRSLRVTVALKEDIEYKTVLVDRPP